MRRRGEQMVPERSEDKWYRKVVPGNVCATNDTRWYQETPGDKWYRKACGDMIPGYSRGTNGSFDCDSSSANDADIDDDIDDGGKQQRKQMQQQHSSPGTKTSRFATTPLRATAPPSVPKTETQQRSERHAKKFRGEGKAKKRQ